MQAILVAKREKVFTNTNMPVGASALDTANFIKTLSPSKLANMGRVYSSYLLAKKTHKPVQWGMPFNISIEPTTACNLRCPECPSGLRSFTRDTGMMKNGLYGNILDQLQDTLVYLYFYFQGEPYLNPAFLDMAAQASSRGIYTVTSTNGHFLDDERARQTVESGLSRVIISIDGTTQDTYQSYRKEGELDKVLQGAANLVKWKKQLKSTTPHIIFQFLVVKPNEHQIPEVYRLAKEIGVDEVKLKTAQIYDFEHGNPLIPEQDQYSRYAKQPNGTFQIKNKLENHCWKLWHSSVITWDGLVVPCCFDKDAKHKLGDLKTQSFNEVWRGDKYQDFRSRVLLSRNEIDICKNCTEGLKVWA
jgi:radical SAM protein with 4Fe4S-binding SPASM domain